MSKNAFNTLKDFPLKSGATGKLYSLPALAREFPAVERLPVSIRIILESVLRNCDGNRVTEAHIRELANWKPKGKRVDEIPFVVARVILQDFTGVPLLADLAAMRSVSARLGKDPKTIEPLVPVDLVVDHSVMIDHFRSPDALELNMKLEFQRNAERYQFMKWATNAIHGFRVFPPGTGIMHTLNLEQLATVIAETKASGAHWLVPDTLLGTDSHTPMINGIGVLAWGIG
ncbi:MAG: aconitase family protein, partial [Gammaproteobacteria bacterium]